MKILKSCILGLLILYSFTTLSQIQLNFFIKDSTDNQTLFGATVIEVGTTNGAVADFNGKARLYCQKSKNLNFRISYLGYHDYNLNLSQISKDSIIEVLLSPYAEETDEIIISTSRTNSHIDNIPTRVEVLGLDEMQEENGIKPGNILSILTDMAGIQMQQTSVSSGNAFIRIQGLNGQYTQFLKDGIPLFGGLSGSFGVLQIPPLDLKQIEIIKGSCATLYGGDAIGGVINLISKVPENKQELSLTINRTTLNENNFNLYASRKYKKVGYTLFAGTTMQQESDIDKDSLSDVPNIKSFVIHPKLIYYINPSSSLTFNYTISIDERKGGEMMYFENQANDTLYHVKTDIYRHNADIKYLNELSANKNLTVKLSTNSFKQHLQTKYYNFEANQLIYYTEISYFQQAKQMNWVVGVNLNGDHFKHEIQKFSSLEDYNYQTLGFFLQHTLIIQEKLTIETGLRFDYHNTYHFFPLPRLSLMYKFNRTLNARINAGLGYKIPNIISNIDPETELKKFRIVKPLLAEYSQGINADINYTSIFFNRLNITINQAFFFTNINQPIFKQLLSDSSFSLSNGSKSLRTAGFQTYSRIKFSKFELYIGYTFTSIIKNYDQLHPRLIATPKHNFSNVFVYEPSKKLRFGIETSFIATQLNQEYHAVRNFLLMAAMIQYNIGEFSFVLNGENLLDIRQSNYERIYNGSPVNPDFHQLWAPIDGRNINFSVKWKLKN